MSIPDGAIYWWGYDPDDKGTPTHHYQHKKTGEIVVTHNRAEAGEKLKCDKYQLKLIKKPNGK